MSRKLVLLVACMVFGSSLAVAAPYLPLESGCSWTYTSPAGSYTEIVLGEAVLFEHDVTVIRRIQPGIHVYFYYSTNPEGDVFYHGLRLQTGYARYYEPPVMIVDAPLWLGKSWETNTFEYVGVNDPNPVPFELCRCCLDQQVIETPAGYFQAWGLGYTNCEIGGGVPLLWVTPGVGFVRNVDVYDFLLESYDVTAVRGVTWSEVKAAFH